MSDGCIIANVQPMELSRKSENHYALGKAFTMLLEEADVILLRQDPPFDMAYITTTHLLERVHPKTLVVNDPHEVRNAPEKLFVTEFKEFMPPTLVSSEPSMIHAFRFFG